jgi:signal transduction histidine kinase
MPPASSRKPHQELARLRERVKELNCLHAISDIVETPAATLEQILQRTADAIPGALQMPSRACARVVLGRDRFCTRNYVPTRTRLVVPFRVTEQLVGQVEAGYLPGAGLKFLPEEERLLKTVGDRVVDAVRLKEAERTLLSYQQKLRSLASQLASTQERERRSLALYLHDRIGQSLLVARLKLKSAGGGARARAGTREVDKILENTIQDIRSLTFEISPPVLYELGFSAALEWLAERMSSDFGLLVRLKLPRCMPQLPEEQRAVLFRSVRELLSNAARHGKARSAEVEVRALRTMIRIGVVDDGIGFDVEAALRASVTARGFGLFSIREQMRSIGGRLEVRSSPGGGTGACLVAPRAGMVTP